MRRAVILADADNTLWDTNAVFADAQLRLLEAVERATGFTVSGIAEDRLAWVRHYDQAIAIISHRRLRYPTSLLVRALAAGLAGVAPADAAGAVVRGSAIGTVTDQDVQGIVALFEQALQRIPKLLPGVRKGLQAAEREGIEVWVLTEGSAERQRARISTHHLDSLIRGVAEATKNKEQFSRHRRCFAPRIVYVIGDQPDRDVAPARVAGCRTVLVPSRFRPEWHEETAWCDADCVRETFDAAVDWVVSHLYSNASRAAAEWARPTTA